MRNVIHQKTSDPENIRYDKIHVEIYSGVGLGKDWRIEQCQESNEIQKVLLK